MIAEIGHALLWLAAACAGLATVAASAARLRSLASPAALAAAWLWLWIGGALAWVFAAGDMSVAAVAANSHAALPMGLRLAAVVLRDGGGLVLASVAAAWLAAALGFGGARARVVGAASGLTLALHALLLVGADPFARLVPPPTDGAGLSRVWRDRLAGLAPPGVAVIDAPLALGAALATDAATVRLAALTPVAGSDSTAVLAEVYIADASGARAVLLPAWRETNMPLHAGPVADSVLTWRGWWSATFGPPGDDRRWRVRVTRLPLWTLVVPVALLAAAGAALAWRVRRRAA